MGGEYTISPLIPVANANSFTCILLQGPLVVFYSAAKHSDSTIRDVVNSLFRYIHKFHERIIETRVLLLENLNKV